MIVHLKYILNTLVILVYMMYSIPHLFVILAFLNGKLISGIFLKIIKLYKYLIRNFFFFLFLNKRLILGIQLDIIKKYKYSSQNFQIIEIYLKIL